MIEVGLSEGEMDRSVPESRRPALRKLSDDVDEIVSEMMSGFSTREVVLRWARRLIPRLLGEMRTPWFAEFSNQFRIESDVGEPVLLSALLTGEARRRDLSGDAVDEVRQRLAVGVIEPVYHRAFRQLRKDATEYVDGGESESAEFAPNKQRFIAMRPALDEIDGYQSEALDRLLGPIGSESDGLGSVDELREWGQLLELASHGELPDRFVERCVRQRSTRALLVGEMECRGAPRARECFAASYLLPLFNRGVRDLRNRSKEEPNAEIESTEVPMS